MFCRNRLFVWEYSGQFQALSVCSEWGFMQANVHTGVGLSIGHYVVYIFFFFIRRRGVSFRGVKELINKENKYLEGRGRTFNKTGIKTQFVQFGYLGRRGLTTYSPLCTHFMACAFSLHFISRPDWMFSNFL